MKDEGPTFHQKSASPLLSKSLQFYFKDYSRYHLAPRNKITHYFGITFIVVSLLGLLSQFHLEMHGVPSSPYFRIDAGTTLIGAASIWYFFLDWKITIPFVLVLIGLYFLGRTISSSINVTLFITGWIIQGIGHALYEKKSPAFLKNLTHLLIGPLWIFARLIGYK